MQKMLVAVVGVVAVAVLAWMLIQKPSAPPPVTVEQQASSTPATTTPHTTNPSLKTYTNNQFNYSFSYPSSWVMDPERNVIDEQNFMPSIVSVHEPKEGQPMRFSVTINTIERTIKNQAPIKEEVTIDGQKVTAYIFPNGLECTNDPDCSFFLIPIKRSAFWFEITGANNAKMLDAYKEILASFTL